MRRTPTLRPTLAAAVALCVAATGCAPEETPPNDDPDPAPPTGPAVTVSPTSGPPGSQVTVEARGFPAETEVEIGIGPPNAWYDEVDRVRTDAAGRAETSVTVPDLELDLEYVFVVKEAEVRNGVRATSERFTLTRRGGGEGDPPEGQVRLRGEVTDEGVECPAVRGEDGELYTLAGAPGWVEPGVRVEVEGPVAEMSICMQGTTIQVERIERL